MVIKTYPTDSQSASSQVTHEASLTYFLSIEIYLVAIWQVYFCVYLT